MPLPVGTWAINADGTQGQLVIGTLVAPDSSGNVFFQGTLTFPALALTEQVTGFWDEAGQEISFLSVAGTSPSSIPFPYQVFADFRGKLYSFPQQLVGSNFVTTYTLAGAETLYSTTDSAASWNTLISGKPGLWCAQQQV